MTGTPKFIIVVGASAGGLHALMELCAQVDTDMDASVFVVLHFGQMWVSDSLMARLQKVTGLTCRIPVNDERIKTRHIYLAASDKHMIVKKQTILLGEGPAENLWRPSIDVMFRSAAIAWGSRVIGIVLSGMLDDGRDGMRAIKTCGGTCIVQDPNEAEYPDMPLAILNNMQADYCAKLEEMGGIIKEKAESGFVDAQVPDALKAEAAIAERVAVSIDNVRQLGDKSLFACPDCGGGLWEMKGRDPVRYRCHIGHAYTEKELAIKQSDALEGTLWIAVRMMEERRHLLMKMSEEEKQKGWSRSAASKMERAVGFDGHILRLKQLLFDVKG